MTLFPYENAAEPGFHVPGSVAVPRDVRVSPRNSVTMPRPWETRGIRPDVLGDTSTGVAPIGKARRTREPFYGSAPRPAASPSFRRGKPAAEPVAHDSGALGAKVLRDMLATIDLANDGDFLVRKFMRATFH